MKLTQKAKYIIYGAITATFAIPLFVLAEQTISLTFKDGDVISANVMNQIFGRINNVVTGFTSPVELDGGWNCATYEALNPTLPLSPNCAAVAGTTLIQTKTGLLTFTATNKTWTYSGAGTPDACVSFLLLNPSPSSGSYDVLSNHIYLNGPSAIGPGTFTIVGQLKKVSPTQFTMTGFPSTTGATECSQNLPVPSAANNLSGSVTGTSVALSWVDQDANETGFRIGHL